MKTRLVFLFLAVALLVSCASLESVGEAIFGGGDSGGNDATEAIEATTGLMVEFRWWMLIAILLVKQARVAVGIFLTNVFEAAALPFTMALDWYKGRKSKKEKERES